MLLGSDGTCRRMVRDVHSTLSFLFFFPRKNGSAGAAVCNKTCYWCSSVLVVCAFAVWHVCDVYGPGAEGEKASRRRRKRQNHRYRGKGGAAWRTGEGRREGARRAVVVIEMLKASRRQVVCFLPLIPPTPLRLPPSPLLSL